jgi:hypothetical protein
MAKIFVKLQLQQKANMSASPEKPKRQYFKQLKL